MPNVTFAPKIRAALCTEGFYKAFNPKALGMPDVATFFRVAQTAANLGYTGIEIAPATLAANPLALSESLIEEYRAAAREAQVEIVGLHWLLFKVPGNFHLTSLDSQVQRNTETALTQLIRLTDQLGGKVVVHGSPNQRNLSHEVSQQTALNLAAGLYRRVLNKAAGSPVLVCFEQLSRLETDFITTLAAQAELIRAVGRPNFVGHLDVKALFPACPDARTAASLIKEHAAQAGHFHLNDWTNMSGPGCGELDMEPIFQAIGESGYYRTPLLDYQRWLSVEFFDFMKKPEEVPEEKIIEIAETSLATIQKFSHYFLTEQE